jgi:uncharacterized protein YbjQ (UPF0145 family)
MALVATCPRLAHDWLKHENDPNLHRETVVVVSGAGNLLTGTVLGKVTATGKYKPYDNDASDGSQTAIGVLVYDADATDADAAVVVLKRSAEVWAERLQWASTVATGEKAPAYTELAAVGIIVR